MLAAAVLAAVAVAVPAHAFRMIHNLSIGRVTAGAAVPCNFTDGFVHWGDSSVPIPWFHNTAGQGSNKARALFSAMRTWNAVPSADHVLTYAGTTSAGFVTDGINAIGWDTGQGCSGSCLALTALVLGPGQEILESDITFNDAHPWTVTGANFDTWAVAAHELGHALGIHHTELVSLPRPTMYAAYFGADGRTLENDDVLALQCAEATY